MSEPGIELIDEATDGIEAALKTLAYQPDAGSTNKPFGFRFTLQQEKIDQPFC